MNPRDPSATPSAIPSNHPLARPGGFHLIAYRGGCTERPENTLSALANARRSGAIPEFDLQCTADGVIVALHDLELQRTTEGRGRVDQLPYAAIGELNAAHRFKQDAGCTWDFSGDTRVPTLDQILGYDDGPLILDVKFQAPWMLRNLVTTIARHRAQARVLLTNELAVTHYRLTRLRPRWLYSAGPLAVRTQVYAERLRLDRRVGARKARIFLPERHGTLQVLTPRLLATARALDQQLIIWLVDDSSNAERLRELGVAGVYTSRPQAMGESLGIALPPAQPAQTLGRNAKV